MIPTERAHVKVVAISHPGMSGKNNEDRYGVSAYRLGTETGQPSILAVVADGIGGHRAGEVAADLAVETISQAVAASDAGQPVQILQNAIIRASQVINQQAEADPTLKGMGSTCACAWVIGDRLYTASVGDTRIYLARGNTIRQITTDHTWVQEAIENGALSQEEARSHPNAHVIRRYLGSKIDVVPDIRLRLNPGEEDRSAEANQGVRLGTGDCLLLCSDGLTDLVDDNEILAVLKGEPPEQALDRLVKLANQRGGHDNITVVALQMPNLEPAAAPAPVLSTGPGRRFRVGATCLAVGLLLAVAVLAVGGSFWLLNRPPATQTPNASVNPSAQATRFPQGVGTAVPGGLPTLSPGGAAATSSPTSLQPFPGTLASNRATPALATLTPWPTNTLAP